MRIPRSKRLVQFVREVAGQCMSSRVNRNNRYAFYQSFVDTGSADPATPAIYNKLFVSLDDLESLLFSPVSLRFHIGDPDIPNVVNEAKGRAAAARIRNFYRQCDGDSMLSQAVNCGLIKGKGIIKQTFANKSLATWLVQPDDFGVYRENYTKLDEHMGAFTHSMMITRDQFRSLVHGRPDEAELLKKSKNYIRESTGGLSDTRGSAMNIVVGGLYPLQAAAQGGVNPTRGLVDWMGTPRAQLDPVVEQSLIELHETWIWDDERDDWATFQMIDNSDMMIMGRDSIQNAMAFDSTTLTSAPCLKGLHPYVTFCPNPVPNYFWGASEVQRLIYLQEAINSRIIGTNKMLRMQEDPTTKFVGSTGVNQIALSRYKKPGGYYAESNPGAKIEKDNVQIPQDLWASLHEYERMFDELMGLPPVAKGHGEKGVRSANHADALIRMFSPRFKDRALLIERDIEHSGALTLDLARAHVDKKLWAWVPKEMAGVEDVTSDEELKAIIPPAPGLVPVMFSFADLPDDVTLTVDEHSSSPAFSQEAKSLVFDMLKTGMMSPVDAIEHLDITDPEALQAGVVRREIARAEAEKEAQKLKLAVHSGGKK
jgi:hypothetical protein